jgi:hypothetical protein
MTTAPTPPEKIAAYVEPIGADPAICRQVEIPAWVVPKRLHGDRGRRQARGGGHGAIAKRLEMIALGQWSAS